MTLESIKDNPVVAAMLKDSFNSSNKNGVMGTFTDKNGASGRLRIHIDENGYSVDLMDGLDSNLDASSYETLEVALTAKVSETDAAKIVAVVKDFREAMNNLNKKYAQYFAAGDYLNGYWKGDEATTAKMTSDLAVIEKEYKVTDSMNNDARIWQAIGSVNVAFEWGSGFAVIVK